MRKLCQVRSLYLSNTIVFSQSTKNSKFEKSLQYLKKEGMDELDFLHEGEHQSFLQLDFINFCEHDQSGLKYPKQQIFNIVAISQGRSE